MKAIYCFRMLRTVLESQTLVNDGKYFVCFFLYTAKSGDFEEADSCGWFCEIGHFSEKSATFEYIMYIKD